MSNYLKSPVTCALASSLLLGACAGLQPQTPSSGHIKADTQPPAIKVQDIPAPVAATATLQRPKPSAKTELYSVSVRNVMVQELLFALARDAKLNVDIHPGINGVVTINAIDQTLQQILNRISKQVDMRWELDGPNLAVMPDSPFLRTYKVDYVNMSRDVTGTVSINTQIASTSTSATTGGGSVSGGNNSTTSVKSEAKNHFWESLDKNLKDILRETDKILPEGSSETVIERNDQQATTGTGAQGSATSSSRSSSTTGSIAGSPNPAALQQSGNTVVRRTTFREAASVITNPDAGLVVIRATARQHEKIQEYIDLVTTNARRQVIIEATIAEVTLNDAFKQGINWNSLRTARPGARSAGLSIAEQSGQAIPDPISSASSSTFSFLLNYISPGLGITSTLSLLETFGDVKVLSSPKISVLNNQTAMLKVVDNLVYFEIKNDTTTTTTGTANNFTATAKSISVGLVMSVTPQISESGSVLLNVRPTISSKTGDVQDPTPNLGAVNNVPVIQTREMESMLRLSDGEIGVMGGLMEDRVNYSTNGVPGVSSLPGIGSLFRARNDSSKKTELVIFLKPTIIRNPSVAADYKDFSIFLPAKDFLQRSRTAVPPVEVQRP